MNSEQREALRQDVLRWIQSKDFDGYFGELHLTPGTLGMASLGCLMKPGRINPAALIRGARHRGVATGALRKHYQELAETGQVVLADTWMANSGLTAGEVLCAPALLIAGADGTVEADNYVLHITQKLAELSERPPATEEEREILSMLDDEEYHLFRVRTLPLGFTENYPVYLFDTMLHRSAVPGGELQAMPLIVCLVDPQMQPAILPIPCSMVAPYYRSSPPSPPVRTVAVASGDEAMEAAVATARAHLPLFWEVFGRRDRDESGFSLKARIADDNGVEYFWLTDIERRDGRILGRINNDPTVVTIVKLGDKVEVPEEIITDWLYLREGKMVGNYTLRVLFDYMPPDEVSRYRQIMVDA